MALSLWGCCMDGSTVENASRRKPRRGQPSQQLAKTIRITVTFRRSSCDKSLADENRRLRPQPPQPGLAAFWPYHGLCGSYSNKPDSHHYFRIATILPETVFRV